MKTCPYCLATYSEDGRRVIPGPKRPEPRPTETAGPHGIFPSANEFALRFNRRFYPFNAFRSLLGIGGDTAAPTYASLYSGEWKHATVSGHD